MEFYEKRNKQIGMTTSLILHLLLLIFFLLYKAWPFDPPLAPQIGVMVNFGTSDVGSGDTQTEEEVGENTEASEETSESESENTEESASESAESSESESESESVEESSEVIESDVESLEENTVNETTTEETTETETTESQSESETESESESQTEEVNENNLMGGNSSNNNNGDDDNEVGDKGDENGDVNTDNLMGNQGGGNGANLNMAGWTWDNLPSKKDNSDETGKIVFRIVIDEDGIIEDVNVVSSTVSVPVQTFYRDLLYKEARLKKISGYGGSSSSTGTVTWYIKAK